MRWFFVFSLFFLCRHITAQSLPISLLPSLRLWVMADSLSAVDTLSGKLVRWTDHSGLSNHLSPVLMNEQPSFINSVYNNHPGVFFDGVDDYIKSADLNLCSNVTFVLIGQVIDYQNFDAPLLYAHGAPNQGIMQYILRSSEKANFNSMGNNIETPALPWLSPFYNIGQGYGNSIRFEHNQNKYGPSSFQTYSNPNAPLFLGGNNFAGGMKPMKGIVFEWMVFCDTLSPDQASILKNYIYQKYSPKLNLGSDYSIQGFCDTLITAYNHLYTGYQWNTGSSDSIITINSSGTYSVTVTDILGFTQVDSIYIGYPNINLNVLPILCQGDTLIWNTGLSHAGYDFIWNDLTTDSVLTIQDTGVYSVVITDTLGCSSTFLSPRIGIDSFPLQASLGPDTTLCSGNTISLVSHAPEDILEYLWSTGSIYSELAITNSGTYGIYAKNFNQCEAYDTIQIIIQGTAPQVHYLSPSLMCEGAPVSFTDSSYTIDGSQLTGWEWQISNIDTLYVQNPTYTFNSSGLYPVQLYVQSSNGCRGLLKDTFNVQPSPQAQFSTNTNLYCSSQEVSFTNLSSSTAGVVTGVFWNFGSTPSDTSHLINPVFAYENSGNYSMFMVASNSLGCQDTIFEAISVLNSPQAGLLMDSACTGTSVQFSDNSLGNITLWAWDFGNGSTSTQVNPTTLYSSMGQYAVQLTVVDQNSCVDDTLVQHRVLQSPQIQLNHSPICFDQVVSFSGNSMTYNGPWQSILWQAESEGQFWTSTSDTFLFTPAIPSQPLVVSVQMVDSAGCVASKVDTFDVYSSPQANFSFSPLYGNPPLNISLIDESEFEHSIQWTIESMSQTNPVWTYEFLDTGSYAIQLIAQNIEGCADTLIQKIQVGNLKYDVALTDLKVLLALQNDRSEVQVNLNNRGNIPVFEAELLLDIHQNKFSWLETWNSTQGLWPGQTELYVFNAQVQFSQLSRPQYLCSKVQIPNVETDLTNNILCTAINTDSLWAMLYPNPVIEDALYLRLINPISEPLTVSVYSPLGDLVFSQSYAVFEQQWKEVLINTTHMHSGTYILEVRGASEDYRTLFQVLRSID